MGDRYKHEEEGVSSVINALKNTIDSYKDRIIELTNLVKQIEGSSSWKDLEVKTAFISTCNSYILVYKSSLTKMEKYVNYLSGKSNSAAALERAYSR